MELHRAAQELDTALRLGDLAKAGSLLTDVESELSRVINGLAPLAGQARGSTGRHGISRQRLRRGG